MTNNMYKGPKAYQNDGKNKTPYNPLLKEYDEYIGEVRKDRNKWRTFSLVALSLCGVMVLVILYSFTLPKTVPYVIKVSPWGEAEYVGDIGTAEYGGIDIMEQSKLYYIRKTIENLRGIPVDKTIFVKNLEAAYQLLTQKAAAVASAEIEADGLYDLFGTIRREVNVESIINVTGNAWQIDWIETDYGLYDANIMQQKRMRAVITLSQGKPIMELGTDNPLGLYFESYQRQVIQEK